MRGRVEKDFFKILWMVGGGLKIKFTIQASFLRIKINCCAQKVNVGLLGQVVDFSSVRNIDTLVKINI